MPSFFKKSGRAKRIAYVMLTLLTVSFVLIVLKVMNIAEEQSEEQSQERIDWRISQLSSQEAQGAIVFHKVGKRLLLVQSDEYLIVFFTTNNGDPAPHDFSATIVKKERDRKWFGGIVKVVLQGTLEYASAKEGFTVAAFDRMLHNK